ncbi:MAG: NUMOD4 domain-containing protein [Candidatus Cyclobacteriaceae bacterium M3_2C_046]
MNTYKNEIWKQIDFKTNLNHPKYEVSNRGRVKSYANDKLNGRIIKGSDVNGYRSIMVRFEGGLVQSHYVHRLVAQYFLKKTSQDQHYVIHLDYDKKNNDVYNLKWATEVELIDHNNANPAVLHKRTTGYKLTEPKVRAIKRLLKNNKTRLYVIAKRFGISHTQLNRIRSGENWGHVS